jgi:RNA polymerase sigma-70 factor (ECF subfamily)
MPSEPTTRQSLLIRLRDVADDRAWVEFVDIYGPLIRASACRRGLQAADADDLAQEVFRVVASTIEQGGYDPNRGKFRPWLFRIARNLTINAILARSRQPRGTGDTAMIHWLEEQPSTPDDNPEAFEAEYRRRMLGWAAERVRGEFSTVAWQAFWATGVEGQAAGEVAGVLGISVGSVYNARSRVMARLRVEIRRAEGEDEPEAGGEPPEGPSSASRTL